MCANWPPAGTLDPLKITIEGFVFAIQKTAHWTQVSITPTSGPTHYMRLPHDEAEALRKYLNAAYSSGQRQP
jgi:hypothetical protein